MMRTFSWLGLLIVASLGGGCAVVTPVAVATSVATSAGTNLAMNLLFSEDKLKRDARAAYERAPPCSSMVKGVPNGRVVTVVRDAAWFDTYDFGDGRRLVPTHSRKLVFVAYDIANHSDADVVVAPRRLTLIDAKGTLTPEKAGEGGVLSDDAPADEGALLPAERSWTMLSVFEVAPGNYVLIVPNGRAEGDPEPTWFAGCRIPPPNTGRS